ncbi:formate dehydrogenase subunit delta [Pseudonocardia phyllosphaerae]|uniref:formate dehydrogenase subunit delta n=1 Tax=Pseudonocardia phyllosphaerae TaxID=3390502 RepID=UPI0039787896
MSEDTGIDTRPDEHTGHTEPACVRMVNDIALHFRHRPEDDAAEAIAGHLQKYWDPRMKAALRAHADDGGEGLDRLALLAAERLPQ